MTAPPLVVRVEGTLLAPIALPHKGFIVGDALLHAARIRTLHPDDWVWRQPATWEDVPLPIAQRDGIALASCVRLSHTIWDRVGLSKLTDAQALVAKPSQRGTLDVGSDRQYMYRGAVERFDVVWAPRFVIDYAVPADQLRDFLDLVGVFPLLGLGRRVHQGYGRIGSVTATRLPDHADPCWAADGAPLRPVPPAWCADPPPRSVLRTVRLRPPYWYGPETVAYCPHPTVLYDSGGETRVHRP